MVSMIAFRPFVTTPVRVRRSFPDHLRHRFRPLLKIGKFIVRTRSSVILLRAVEATPSEIWDPRYLLSPLLTIILDIPQALMK